VTLSEHLEPGLTAATGSARALFLEQLAEAMDASRRRSRKLAVLALDMPKLRSVNLELGYRTGDAARAQAEQRLRAILRPCDFMARVGSAELALVLPELISAGQATLAANRILEVCGEAMDLGGEPVRMGVAVGLALYPDHGEEPELLLRRADAAAARAHDCATRFVMHSAEQGADAGSSSLALEGALEAALRNGDLDLHFQPKIDLQQRCFVGVEALARWSSPSHGAVRPDVFVPVAERAGLILPLTMWVLNIALRQSRDFASVRSGFSVAVNLSASLLSVPDMPELVMRALRIWDVDPAELTLEVTENAMMAEPEASLETLHRLSEIGVRLSVDDFGTGYSSLGYLKRLPIDEIKVDKSFVMNMANDEGDRRIVEATVGLAHGLGLGVVAEGIEDEDSLTRLAQIGCGLGQGFYMARPMPRRDLLGWVRKSPYAFGAPARRADPGAVSGRRRGR